MDSITRALVEAQDKGVNNLINRIRLILNADISRKKAVILVEGPDDIRFVKVMFGEEANCLYSTGGKNQLIELIKNAEIADKRVIAIRDKDYSDPSKYPARIFAYDYCSLELMILHHDKMRKQMSAFCDVEEIKEDFPIKLLRHIAPFSYLRMINEQKNLNINLNRGVLSGLGEKAKVLPDMRTLFQRLDVEERLEECQQSVELLDEEKLWNITNGHDVCSSLGRISHCDRTSFGEDSYRTLLINTYRKEDFQDTLLYSALVAYHEKYGVDLYELTGGGVNEV